MADETGLAAFTPSAPPPAASQVPATPRQISPNVAITGITDESVRQYEFELFAGTQDKTDRIFILNPMNIVKARSHYHDKLKGGVQCKSVYIYDPTSQQDLLREEKQCCKWLGAPNLRFGVLVVVYNTDQFGNAIVGPGIPFKFKYKLWRFGADKFAQLRSVNRDFPLSKFDLKILCTEKQFQKMQIAAAPLDMDATPPSGSWLLDPRFPEARRQEAFAWAKASEVKILDEVGGRKFENDGQLQQHLLAAGILTGAGMAPQSIITPGDAPVQSFADIITTATSSTTGPPQPAPQPSNQPLPGMFPAT